MHHLNSSCLMCDAPMPQQGLCSARCSIDAEREIARGSERLAELHGYERRRLAERIGCLRSMLLRWESGTPVHAVDLDERSSA